MTYIIIAVVIILLLWYYFYGSSVPEKKCYQAPGIRLMGGGWVMGDNADHGKNYGGKASLADCEKACRDDSECKQYVWVNDTCYPMKNEYGLNKDSFRKEFISGYCNSESRQPPMSL
jgi:hypothetical protein